MSEQLLRAALEYHQRGWSLIPMAMAEKRPRVKWKRYQTRRASENTLRKWFGNGEHGIGVVFGEISSGLLSRDFDTMESYEQWAKKHTDLAKTLPTVGTSRGRHVYARASQQHIADVRQCLGKPNGVGALCVADGELRCGVGCYSVLPPSVHPSGVAYRWEVPLPKSELPEIDVFTTDFYETLSPNIERSKNGPCNREHRGLLRRQKITEAIISGCDEKKIMDINPSDWSESVQWAIVDSVPEAIGQRHRQVFELARGLKAVPELADADAGKLKPYVQQWHKLSVDRISTKPFSETWIDFLKAWPRVQYPKGADPMTAILERVTTQPLPTVAQDYDQQQLQVLVALCRELQRSAGNGPFYLSCRTAGRLLGVDHTTANRWLFLLAHDGIVEISEPGDRAKRKAARYRYLAPI